MGLFLKAGAIFVAELTGLNDPLQLKLIMTAMIVLVLVYTILGGMVSVVITDFVQFIVLSIGLMLACLLAVRQIGWSTLIGVISEVHGPAGFDPLAEGAGFGPTYVMWMIITAGIVSSAVWQTAVVRASAAESVEAVRRLYTWSSIGMLVRFMLPQFLGVCALAYLWNQTGLRADFFTADGGLVAGDQSLRALPVFLGQLLPTGLIGLIGAGMLAAFMSTHDSYLPPLGQTAAAAGAVLHPAHRRVSARVEPLVPARTRHVGLHGHHGRDLLHERAGPPGRGPVLEEGQHSRRLPRAGLRPRQPGWARADPRGAVLPDHDRWDGHIDRAHRVVQRDGGDRRARRRVVRTPGPLARRTGMTWATFWAIVLSLSMLAFTILVIWVAAGGASDIRALLDSIEAQHEEEPGAEDKG
jgi:hypothetical protein